MLMIANKILDRVKFQVLGERQYQTSGTFSYGNAWYHSDLNVLFSCVLCKNLNIKIYITVFVS
jgi:hypothetical protein